MSYRVLKDSEMASQMEEQGYIILPFLNEDEIAHFKSLYKKHHPEDPEFFYKSYFSSDIEYKLEVEEEIIKVFEKRLGHLFFDHRVFGGMFVAKPPLEKGHFTCHQDWSFTDETVYPSYNMWCPLDDVNDHNGNLNVLKGSHRFLKTIRGYGTPDVYDHLHKVIEPNMISLPMKAGQVVIFYHGLVHGSTLNVTDRSRVSLGLSIVHQKAPLRFHYYDADNDTLEQYESTPEYYIHYVDQREEKPKTIKYLGELDFNFERLTFEQLKINVAKNQSVFIEKPKDASLPDASPTAGASRNKSGLIKKLMTLFD